MVSGEGAHKKETKLIRMNPEGSNRVELFDFLQFGKDNGSDFVYCDMITEGYCMFSTYCWMEMPDGSLFQKWQESYLYKLDGSMDSPKKWESVVAPLYNCGNILLSIDSDNSYYDLNLETDTTTFLTEFLGVPGWFAKDEVYYFKDGAIHRLIYGTKNDEILAQTDLEGDYILCCFPDCIVVASQDLRDADSNMYIYNWEFELVDTVTLNYPHEMGVCHLIAAETSNRFVLTDDVQGIPKYYIEKSELGTGNAKVYQYDLSAVS